MKSFCQIALIPMVLVLTVEWTQGRDLRDSDSGRGLLLSALCIEDGQLRNACLEDISSLSIQNFLDTLITRIQGSDRYSTLLRELELENKDDVISTDDVVPEKRGRPRQASGFYSNW